MPPTWQEIRDLTRLRRKQAGTVRINSFALAQRLIATYDAHASNEIFYGIATLSAAEKATWRFQCGRCYICAERFTPSLPATREHVTPRALGGKNVGNVLMACVPCNNIKADRPPTTQELHLLNLANKGDRIRFIHCLLFNAPKPQTVKRRKKRKGLRKRR